MHLPPCHRSNRLDSMIQPSPCNNLQSPWSVRLPHPADDPLTRVQDRILRLVAQDCILLYRGFAIRKPFVNPPAPQFPLPAECNSAIQQIGKSALRRILSCAPLTRIFPNWRRSSPALGVGTARCAVTAAFSGGTACPEDQAMSNSSDRRSAPERRGDVAARRPYLRAVCETFGLMSL